MDRLNQIRQYFDGNLSREEAYEFLRWFNSIEHEDEVQAELDKLWHTQDHSTIDWDRSHLFTQILQKRNNVRELGISKKKPLENKTNSLHWVKIAAAIALLFASILVYYQLYAPENEQIEVLYDQIIKSNPVGQKSRVYLPDGSVVNLNSDSEISYTESFVNGREVHLSGEAFFEVKKDSLRPFTVNSGRLSTTALGTSFNINAFTSGEEEVVLVSGKVCIKDQDTQNKLLLEPGEKVLVSKNDASFEKTKADIQSHLYWRDGILYFDKTSIVNVIATLERWYGVRIKVDGRIPDDRCTGLFKKNEYLTNVLDILSHSVAFEYQLDNKELKLIFNK